MSNIFPIQLIIQVRNFPFVDSFFITHVSFQDEAKFISPYNCSETKSREETRRVDFIESIFSFDLPTWLTCCAFLIVFIKLLHNHYRMNKQPSRIRHSGVWTVITFVLKNACMKEINWVSRILLLNMTLAMFFIGICHFENGIKSDKCTVYNPFVYESYDDIIEDPDVNVLFKEWEPVMLHFKDAPHGSKLKRIYDKAKERHPNGGVEFPEMLGSMTSIPVKKNVFISNGIDVANTRCILCNVLILEDKPKHQVCYYLSTDQSNPIQSTIAIFVSENFMKNNSEIFSNYESLTRRFLETGIHDKSLKGLNAGMELVTPDIEECARDSRSPVTHDRGYEPLSVSNYMYALISLLIPFMIALINLWMEKFIISSVPKVKVKKVKRKIFQKQRKVKSLVMINE